MVTSVLGFIRTLVIFVQFVFSILIWFFPGVTSAHVEVGDQVSVMIQGQDLIKEGMKSFFLSFPEAQRSQKVPSKKGTVIVFLSARCPCSRSHLARLNLLYRDFAKDFDFVGVHSNGNESLVEAEIFFKSKAPVKLSFPVIRDGDARVANYFGAAKTPHAYIVGPDPEAKNHKALSLLFRGGVDDTSIIEESEQKTFSVSRQHYLRDALNAIQKGKKPAENNVRVLGCKIERP